MNDTQTFSIFPPPPEQGNLYCGPMVLALLSGKSRAEIHADVNRLRRAAGKKRNKNIYYRDGTYKTSKLMSWPLTSPVRGMSNKYLEVLLKKYLLSPITVCKEYGSLRQLVNDMGHLQKPIVINVTDHYVLYLQVKIYDTACKEGKPVEEHPYGRSRVKKYWLINKQPKNKINITPTSPQKKPAAPKKDLQILRYERALAAQGRWKTKAKRAESGLKKATATVRRYEKIFASKKAAATAQIAKAFDAAGRAIEDFIINGSPKYKETPVGLLNLPEVMVPVTNCFANQQQKEQA